MTFHGTDEQRMLADSLRRFVADNHSIEQQDRLTATAPGHDQTLWRGFAELGAIGALFAPADGGYGGSGGDIATVFEECGAAGVASPLLATLIAGTVLIASRANQAAPLLQEVIAGDALVTLAHQEPGSRHALSVVESRAVPDGDGWRLSGAKSLVAFAEAADWLIVSARTSAATGHLPDFALFLVPATAEGITMRGFVGVDGSRGAEVVFDDVAIGGDAMLASGDVAEAAVELGIGRGILALCADTLGALGVVTGSTTDYLRTRVQFGQPIGSFQALQHRLATMLIEIEQARSALTNAIAGLEGDRTPRERALSAAKYTFGTVATLVAEEAVQMHGGIGMTWELPTTRLVKRLMMLDHQLGDADHHIERYIRLGKAA